MPSRERNGKWEYRFWVNGREYSRVLDLDVDTEQSRTYERNKLAAQRQEAKARQLVLQGEEHQLRLQVVPFSDAAQSFQAWAWGEYREHQNTARRLAVSTSSMRAYFSKKPVLRIGVGDVEDYKAWRRICQECKARRPAIDMCKTCGGTGQGVREITLRHDLHAMSLFFQYAVKHSWARENPVRQVEIPSDEEAVRMHVLTPAEEGPYFQTCLRRIQEAAIKEHCQVRRGRRVLVAAHKRVRERDYQDLYDLGRLMILQGPRPAELRELEQDAVDLLHGVIHIRQGKSRAARRTLRLLAESREILVRRLQTPGRWVFPSPRNPGKHIGCAQRPHEIVLRETGLVFVPYDLRHTFATRAAENGMPLPTLAAILGHGNLRSVMKYVHISQEHMDREMVRLERFSVPAQDAVQTQGKVH
jgi:integrase